ncbi:immunoglobulin gamma-1 heavy chain-like isoform X2 [Microcaecilia unicolor]|uniref:immunoglobulin gamma-1 heavy chain-like isoform X2 n=1 Tax=Microcaecilia unicolor TaxID=1415580 RepID=UPI0011871FF3|nr:immunoglobulin gamma-1 heavy chain-like isoform X2 [Microcaecilia unicolor]
MKPLCISLFLFGVLSRVHSQNNLQESGPGVLKPGETLRVTCKFSSGFSGSWLAWIRQPPGKGLEWLGEIYSSGSTNYAPSLQSRLTITRDNSKYETYLQVRGTTAADTATYYCARAQYYSFGGLLHLDVWGQGTMLTVTTEEKRAPTVYPLIPCCGDLSSTDTITVGCLMSNYLPQPVSVYFRNNSKTVTTGIKSFPVVFSGTGPSYTSSSQLVIPSSDWEAKTYYCDVSHAALNPKKTVTLKKTDCKQETPLQPTVLVFHETSGKNEIKLVCLVTKFRDRDVKAQWLVNGNKELSRQEDFSPVGNANQILMGNIEVLISKEDWDKGDVYNCKVTHKWEEFHNISKCSASSSDFRIPAVYLLKPSYGDLINNNKSVATCFVLGTDLAATTVSWETDGKSTKGKTPKDPFTHPNNTQSIQSTSEVSLEQWKTGITLTCKVKHPCSEEIEKKVTTKLPTTTSKKSPKVVISKSIEGQFIVLLCVISGFYPEDISWDWYKNGNTKVKGFNYTVGPVVESQGTFSTFTILRVPRTMEMTSYVIKVHHISSAVPVTKTEPNVFEHPAPKTYIIPPSFEELFVNNRSNITLVTNDLNASVTWIIDGKPTKEYSGKTIVSYPNGTRWLHITLTITLIEWKTMKTFSSQLNSQLVSSPMQLNIAAPSGQLKAPRVHLVPPPSDEVSTNSLISLLCLVEDFYPEGVFVTWQKNGTEVNRNASDESNTNCNHESQQCSLISKIQIPKSDWLAGTSYTCEAAHISSEKKVASEKNVYTDKPTTDGMPPYYYDETCDNLSEIDEDGSVWMTASTFIALFLLTLLYSSFVTIVKVK